MARSIRVRARCGRAESVSDGRIFENHKQPSQAGVNADAPWGEKRKKLENGGTTITHDIDAEKLEF